MQRTKKQLIQVFAGGVLFSAGLLVKTDIRWFSLGMFLAAYFVVGGDITVKALRTVWSGQVFDENFLMSVATIGAFALGEYPEGVGVMLFYRIGELFQGYAVNRSRASIADLMDIRPDSANLKRGEEILTVAPGEVRVGDVILIKAGEKVPLDGVVRNGTSLLDTSALTGESIPREVFPGQEVLSGCINLNGLLEVSVTREYGESTVSKVLELVENATEKKAKTEQFITRFARLYTPFVVALAALLSVLPPLCIPGAVFSDWLHRGLTFLVISCPCALVVSIPLSFFGGIGGASRKGILIKGGNFLETLSRLETVVFDKTGTLTKGEFNVQAIRAAVMEEDELLELAAYAEHHSNHPISASIQKAYGKSIDSTRISDAEDMAGFGVRAVVDGKTVYAGNQKLLQKIGVRHHSDEHTTGTVLFIAVDGSFAGTIQIADHIKEDAKEAIKALRRAGVQKTVMLTGDAKYIGENVANILGLSMAFTELLPEGKVNKLEELLAQQSAGGALAFVGDGINDAPVLARADVGIAMGGLGSDAAIEAADVVIMTDEPSKIATGIRLARRTIGIVKQNIVFSLAVKFSVLALAAMGVASMWVGVAADVGVTVLAIFNATRALTVREG
ncbi:MAG: cadmium-translocating P-type ATPase [Clostridia bacterium]|nr:cadmium-translocating P-type ATPase [Clostridia bacterium]